MTYPDTVRYLLSLGNEVKTAKLGLERIQKVLAHLGNPERAFRSVHIAGTNGKGSTAAMIEAGLRAAGLRTGLYTSPHLVRINERVRADGREIRDADFCAAFAAIHGAVERLLAGGALDLHPTYFECMTALAFWHFRSAGVDMAVVEVGLGGKLDATNVVRPEVAVITAIDFDHEAMLGKAAASISDEKAGILKAGVPAVYAPQRPEAEEVLRARARELGVRPIQVGRDWKAEQVGQVDGYYSFLAAGPSGQRVRAELALAGEHQVTNALAAIAALDVVGVEAAAIEQGVRAAQWPGRLEAIDYNPLVLVDGAHNPAGARALARFLERHYLDRSVWLVYAAMRDKAVEEMAGILLPLAHRVLLTRVSQSRALRPETLYSVVAHHHPHVEVTGSLAEALDRARAAAAPADIILVTGSLFLVGEAKAQCSVPCCGPIR